MATYTPKKTDNSAFTEGTDPVVPIGAVVDEISTGTVTEGNVGAPRMTADRKLLMRLVGATDTNRLDIDSLGRLKSGSDAVESLLALLISDGLQVKQFDGSNLRVRVEGGQGDTPIPTARQNSLVTASYDYLSLSSGTTTDTWSYRTGGASGRLVSTVVITYTDSTKATISTVART